MRFCSTDTVNDLGLHPVLDIKMGCIAARTLCWLARFRWRPRLPAAAGTAPKILREVPYVGELLERRPPAFAGDDFVAAFGIELDVEPCLSPCVRTLNVSWSIPPLRPARRTFSGEGTSILRAMVTGA